MRATRALRDSVFWRTLGTPAVTLVLGATLLASAATVAGAESVVLTVVACFGLFVGGQQLRVRRHLLFPPTVMRLSSAGLEFLNGVGRGGSAYVALAWADVARIVVRPVTLERPDGLPVVALHAQPTESGVVRGTATGMVRVRAAALGTDTESARTTMAFSRPELLTRALVHIRVYHPEVVVLDERAL